MSDVEVEDVLFADLDGLQVDDVELSDDAVIVAARACAGEAACPACRTRSRRVHSSYHRRLADAAVGSRPVVVHLQVRRFRCPAASCPRATFVEQIDGLTVRHGRRSQRLNTVLQMVALMLAGRAGARLAAVLSAAVSRSTLLRLIHALPDPPTVTPRVLGVDDFALRKGHVYGTVLIDVETRRPIDLLPDRESATLARWLSEHPGVEIICRDRASGYAEGARLGAPDAVQVADRWHLFHNLTEAVDRCVTRHSTHLRTPEPPPSPSVSAAAAAELEKITETVKAERAAHSCADRTRDRHQEIHALIDKGLTLREISRELGLARNTVRKFTHAATAEELNAGKWQGRASVLDDYKPYLHQRWQEGCTSAKKLFEEIKAAGFRGGYSVVRDYLQPLRAGAKPADRARRPPSVREVTGWITRHPDSLTQDETLQLKDILTRCPQLDATAEHVRAFAEMMNGRAGHKLAAWIDGVKAGDLPELVSFVNGIGCDLRAVEVGLTLPFSSGAVEGQVNRIKMLKRQMFGRAGLALLRKRVLLAA
ncbi:ISL3 family transposase [Streptomyces sp. P3]|uniref:ISL3 family transposase n=1 Tax=Streptomyces sp. P3 TaxID=2135430 RepID=UPI000D1BB79B|nr:ISL3 family transposase [Streptomyces sp. P3]AVV40484.1 ISL3 family transposase [Streptomyces sp. P3]